MTNIHPQVERARALHPLINHEANEFNRRRELTPPVVKALKEGDFFRMLQPRSIGGMELKPSDFSRVTEAIAAADGSTGWVVCQGNGCSMSAAYLDPGVAQQIFGPIDGILAWGPPGAPFEAEPVEGGYCISGTWRFASGSQNATWLGAHMKVKGRGEVRTMLFPKSSVRMVDIWHTLGLRGTASNEYDVRDLFVPEDHTMLRDKPVDRREEGPLYRFGSSQLYSAGFAGVGLGIARGLIDAFLELPATKVSRGAARPMRENNVVQSQLAQSEAKWHSARAFLHTTLDEIYDYVVEHGEMTENHAAMMRLASTWAIQQARDAVNTMFHCAGSVAVFEEQPFERRLRDIHTVSQQAQGRQLHYETVGQIMLGMPPENQFYEDVVGLKVGERPPLPFPGYWLYCGGVPTVHLIGDRPEDAKIPDHRSEPAPTGRLDHIAFACEGLNDMKSNLESRGIKFDERVLPRFNMTQLFYLDPDGIAVECNFDAKETESTGMKGY